MNLKPCPCGQTPKEVFTTQGYSPDSAYVYSECCKQWRIQFETHFHEYESIELNNLAIQAWNDAPRGDKND